MLNSIQQNEFSLPLFPLILLTVLPTGFYPSPYGKWTRFAPILSIGSSKFQSNLNLVLLYPTIVSCMCLLLQRISYQFPKLHMTIMSSLSFTHMHVLLNPRKITKSFLKAPWGKNERCLI